MVFHSLRVTAITNAGVAGLAPAVRQLFARHSDHRLTDRVYTDAAQLPAAGIAALLPRYGLAAHLGRMAGEWSGQNGTAEWTVGRAASGRFASRRVAEGERAHPSQVLEAAGFERAGTLPVASRRADEENSPTRTRT